MNKKNNNLLIRLTPLTGSFGAFCLLMFVCASCNLCSNPNPVTIETKSEQLKKDGVVVMDNVKYDTLKIGNLQHTYVPLLRQFQNQKGK